MVNIVPILILLGLVWWYLRRRKQTEKSSTHEPPVCADTKCNVHFLPNTMEEDRIAALHREATEHKAAKDWDSAIRCLEEASTLVPNVKISYPIKHYLRLPLFLQQGGYFEASMKEFQKILDATDQRLDKEYAHQKKGVRIMLAHADYAEIYTSMSTACKREKKQDMSHEYKELSQKHKDKHISLKKKYL